MSTVGWTHEKAPAGSRGLLYITASLVLLNETGMRPVLRRGNLRLVSRETFPSPKPLRMKYPLLRRCNEQRRSPTCWPQPI